MRLNYVDGQLLATILPSKHSDVIDSEWYHELDFGLKRNYTICHITYSYQR